MKIRIALLSILILGVAFMTSCSGPFEPTQNTPGDSTAPITEEPTRVLLDGDYIPGHQGEFTGLDVFILESFPVQVQAQVSGYLPNGCVELVDVSSEQEGNTFFLTLDTRRPAGDVMCTEALVPFEAVVALDVYGLQAGLYTVVAGEQQAEFGLDVDNVIN